MNIGFDAKRAFFNRSGLGNYSRSTIQILSRYFSENNYFLFTPTLKKSISFIKAENIRFVEPEGKFDCFFKSYWRTFKLTKQLQENKIDVYHGLSNELPKTIGRAKTKSLVTIHDLIFIRYPELYKVIDRKIYEMKFRFSSRMADKVIAISEQTKNDLIEFFDISPSKIEVVYQGCNAAFYEQLDRNAKKQVREKYNLPAQYILSVGTIEERKNVLNIVKALNTAQIEIPLVVIGRATPYLQTIKQYIRENKLEKQILFFHNVPLQDLPALYQMAEVFVYPSVFEGFGIPILEALNSKVPVITSRGGCFSEAGGPSSIYVQANNPEELSDAIKSVLSDSEKRKKMIEDGLIYAQNFRDEKIAQNLMKVYLSL
jgi:glycosyltransferase involved in cell wall biosynthesis